jgi:hypothetical protein
MGCLFGGIPHKTVGYWATVLLRRAIPTAHKRVLLHLTAREYFLKTHRTTKAAKALQQNFKCIQEWYL